MAKTPEALELWGGVECTVNRVGDIYYDQLEQSGHAERLGDLDLFAGLGLRAMRYPILWERVAPDGLETADWAWADGRLERLRQLGIAPIVGLLHHGNGPRGTSLLDPQFPEKLAAFAGAVATRYPWVMQFTPVNEPLTTARFCGLYGHWYPHGRTEQIFARVLLNQCRATILAMQAIRAVTPNAQLIQTEDMGRVYGTPALAYQVEFENARRWLSLDLLCGRVVRGHRMRGHLHWLGVADEELDWFEENACPPDLLGVDYYPASDRFLDERYERYPPATWGGNGRHPYADVEAVRVRREGITPLTSVLGEAWERYRIPLAVTEAHLGCHPDEQVRWLAEVWQQTQQARRKGVPVRAVTVWALLGAYDWNHLVTRCCGDYEAGVFDVRNGEPQETPLTDLVRSLAAGRCEYSDVLSRPGWWHQPERLLYPSVSCPLPRRISDAPRSRRSVTSRIAARSAVTRLPSHGGGTGHARLPASPGNQT